MCQDDGTSSWTGPTLVGSNCACLTIFNVTTVSLYYFSTGNADLLAMQCQLRLYDKNNVRLGSVIRRPIADSIYV